MSFPSLEPDASLTGEMKIIGGVGTPRRVSVFNRAWYLPPDQIAIPVITESARESAISTNLLVLSPILSPHLAVTWTRIAEMLTAIKIKAKKRGWSDIFILLGCKTPLLR